MAPLDQTGIRPFLANLLRGGGGKAARREPSAAPHAAPTSPDPFHATVKRLIDPAAPHKFKAGCVNVIGLGKVKDQLGTDWPRVAERADRIACNTIARNLLPGDMFSAMGNENYIILFTNLTERQAQTKARLIAREIADTLLGDQTTDVIEVKTASHDGAQGLTFSDAPSLAVLAQTTIEIEIEEVPNPRPEQKPIVDPFPAPVDPNAKIRSGDGPLATPQSDEQKFVYRPIWDIRNNVISGYRCSTDGSSFGIRDEDTLAEWDFAILARVHKDLHDLTRDGRRLLLSLPVHFDTLSRSSRRQAYVNALRNGLPDGKSSLLMLEVTGVPDGVPKGRLVEMTAPLQPLCRAVVVRLALETTDFGAFAGARIPLVGCIIDKRHETELITMKLLGRFADSAQKAGLGMFVGRATSLSLVAAAVGAGCQFIDGECVARSMDKPGDVVSFALADVYRGL